MMRHLFFFFAVLIVSSAAFAARDPFLSVLPKVQPVKTDDDGSFVKTYAQPTSGQQAAPLTIVVQGVFWDINEPRAIIDGEVYKTQDVIKGTDDARIVQIKKNTVVILYNGGTVVRKTEQKI